MEFLHQTVLLKEAVEVLNPGAGKLIVDGTLGGGGHSEALLEAGAQVIGVDRDPRARAAATRRLQRFQGRFRAVAGRFSEVESLLSALGIGAVDGLLLDLGVSSPQFDASDRGFSFQREGPLDMRMGNEGPTAAELIAETDASELKRILQEYGEEPFAGPIARALKKALPTTTLQAAEVVSQAVPRGAWPKRIHVATRTFQALRIWVNDELGEVDRFLADFPRLLNPGGRAAIISFHSLEDRRVKDAFRALEGKCSCPPGLPVCVCGARGAFKVITKKAIAPSEEEISANPRSRSAHLRAVEKIR